MTRELQVVGKAALIAIQTWVRNNDKTRYAVRAEEREKNIGRIGRLFTAWRVSHAERRDEREEGEDDSDEDDTPLLARPVVTRSHTRQLEKRVVVDKQLKAAGRQYSPRKARTG